MININFDDFIILLIIKILCFVKAEFNLVVVKIYFDFYKFN